MSCKAIKCHTQTSYQNVRTTKPAATETSVLLWIVHILCVLKPQLQNQAHSPAKSTTQQTSIHEF
jgi:hypothetical protein